MSEEMDQAQIAPSRTNSFPKVDSIMNRYTDAYQKAHFVDRLGSQVKTLGVVAAILEFLIIVATFGALMGDRSVALFFAACFAAFI